MPWGENVRVFVAGSPMNYVPKTPSSLSTHSPRTCCLSSYMCLEFELVIHEGFFRCCCDSPLVVLVLQHRNERHPRRRQHEPASTVPCENTVRPPVASYSASVDSSHTLLLRPGKPKQIHLPPHIMVWPPRHRSATSCFARVVGIRND